MRSPRATLLILAAALAVLVPGTAMAGYASFEDGPFGVHEDGVEWLTTNEVTNGCNPSEYCPNEDVTRAQMATFMHRLSGHAAGTAPSVDAATLEGREAADLEVVNGFATVTEEVREIDSVVDVEASCPEGTRALGGGGGIDGLYAQQMAGPTAEGDGWYVVWVSDDHRAHEVDAHVTVTCAPTDAPGATASGASPDRTERVESLRVAVSRQR